MVPLRGELEKLSADLGIAERVQFLGSQPHKVVKNWLARAHVFVLPSVTAQNGDVEGIPVALMEAMAAGLTVVSTRHSGIPELIEHGVGGFLSPERDVEALAANLAWIIEHPGECGRLRWPPAARSKQISTIPCSTISLPRGWKRSRHQGAVKEPMEKIVSARSPSEAAL